MSNEMNEAYKKSIAILSELMRDPPSMGSTEGRTKSFATDQSNKGKLARQRMSVLSRRSGMAQTHKVRPGMQTAHTDPTPGPSLHEDYVRMAEILMERRFLRGALMAGVAALPGPGGKAPPQTPTPNRGHSVTALEAGLKAQKKQQQELEAVRKGTKTSGQGALDAADKGIGAVKRVNNELAARAGMSPIVRSPDVQKKIASEKEPPWLGNDLQHGQHKKYDAFVAKKKANRRWRRHRAAQGPQFVGDAERGGHRIQAPKPKGKEGWGALERTLGVVGGTLGAGYIASRRRKRQSPGSYRNLGVGSREDVRSHTDPTPGPSLHETYGRLINIILEYKKRSKEDWERVRLGSELIDPTGKPLTGQQRRKIVLTKERADRKKAAKRKKAAAKRAKAKKKAPAPDPNHGWSVADEPLHYL